MKVLLISGHGAKDVGAVGNGFKEFELTRELSSLIKKSLQAYCDVDIYDIKRNAFKDLNNGTFKIGKYDYVLEIHFNAFTNSSAHGTEIYVTTLEKGTSVEKGIIKALNKYFTIRGSGVKVKDFAVIKHIKKLDISSALLETCFITNSSDMKVYRSCKELIANDIANAIVKGFNLKRKAKSIDTLAKEVISGKWGNGAERVKRLTDSGFDARAVQMRVNELLK